MLLVCSALLLGAPTAGADFCRGRVVDGVTKNGIQGAIVTLGTRVVYTDARGAFQADTVADKIGVRAYGYLRNEIGASACQRQTPTIELLPLKPKALYLSFFGIGNHTLRENALRLIRETELNALVIDVKGDRGMIAYRSTVPFAQKVGAQAVITLPNIKELLASLHGSGIYLIARIVTFKDDRLASARPDWAVRRPDGSVWRDREHLAWGDPFRQQVFDYNLQIATEAAGMGFDEIQFDYARFPDAKGVVFSGPNNQKSRIERIAEFFQAAQRRLTPYNVFVAADIFGYVCWNRNDTGIGQRLEELVPYLDYISPMLYPSSFQFGIPGFRNPVAHPFEIVRCSLDQAGERTNLPAVRFRPWLQAFRDYAFDRRDFKGDQIRQQIRAAEIFGSDGWMLWNPHNIYSGEAIKRAARASEQKAKKAF